MSKQQTFIKLMQQAGVSCGSSGADLQVINDKVFDRVFAHGTLGLGEAYMDGWWQAEALDEVMTKLMQADVVAELKKQPLVALEILLQTYKARLFNMQTIALSRRVGEQHYDVGNDLYEKMLDPWMQYTSAYYDADAATLAEAQEAKLDLIARKLKLTPGMRVLDIGCGWGGLAKFLAERYQVKVTGITISKEQAVYAREWVKNDLVNIEVIDYRELKVEPFDRVVSVGMFEHVGPKNYRTYFKQVSKLLKPDGLFLLDSIGSDRTYKRIEPWLDKYIFPGGHIPSIKQVGGALEQVFYMEDWHVFGDSYDRTLMEWHKNFMAAWSDLSKQERYNQKFFLMWEYYLLMCAAFFRSRRTTQWQLVLSKRRQPGYVSER